MLPGRPYLMKIGARTIGMTIGRRSTRSTSTRSTTSRPARSDSTRSACATSASTGRCVRSLHRQPGHGRLRHHRQAHAGDGGAGLLHFALRRSQNVHWQEIGSTRRRAPVKGHAPGSCGSRACRVLASRRSPTSSSRAARRRRAHLPARRRQRAPRTQPRPGLHRSRPGGEHPPGRRGGGADGRRGAVVLVSFISPFRAERDLARSSAGDGEFIEVFVDTPLDVAEARDPKGLYAKARPASSRTSPGSSRPTRRPSTPMFASTRPCDPEAAADLVVEHLRRTASSSVTSRRPSVEPGPDDERNRT